jgi:cyclopropane-fatty-acyl-phospholipid synthase
MINEFNVRPNSYLGPRTALERRICRVLFAGMIQDQRIVIDYGDNEISRDRYDAAEVVLAAPGLWSALKIMIAPGLWVGESYVAGDWFLKKGTLANFIDIIWQYAPSRFGGYYKWMQRLRGVRHYIRQYLLNRYFTRQVRKHYELDSAIYEMILDAEMVYTCAFFDASHESLEDAQSNKLTQTFERLLQSEQGGHILDIGCGWGAAERFVVQNYPTATICGLSISNNQIEWAKRRDGDSLSPSQQERITYRLQDYVLHEEFGAYDAVCAIGMIEHVGLGGYKEFFDRIAKFLKPNGRALIHTIIAPTRGIPTNRWIDRYIFTGGYVPSVSELIPVIENSAFSVEAIHLHGPINYHRTIEMWIDNLTKNAPRMKTYLVAEGASSEDAEQAVRTWYFYLCAVRNMFSKSDIHAYQVAQLCLENS